VREDALFGAGDLGHPLLGLRKAGPGQESARREQRAGKARKGMPRLKNHRRMMCRRRFPVQSEDAIFLGARGLFRWRLRQKYATVFSRPGQTGNSGSAGDKL
ncbi:hypothetical protein, partial [Brevirhabdus pacifica]|uniref:hypothetical protein n=1 Tax=Brevirhabdus pacifica TaxID=1267768 RepID=UPI001E2CB958